MEIDGIIRFVGKDREDVAQRADGDAVIGVGRVRKALVSARHHRPIAILVIGGRKIFGIEDAVILAKLSFHVFLGGIEETLRLVSVVFFRLAKVNFSLNAKGVIERLLPRFV